MAGHAPRSKFSQWVEDGAESHLVWARESNLLNDGGKTTPHFPNKHSNTVNGILRCGQNVKREEESGYCCKENVGQSLDFN